MEQDTIHSLTAAYALDALDDEDERAFEEHLRGCDRCREELAELTEAAGALAYAVEPQLPPPDLRARIVEQARRERSNVIPFRPRRLPVIVTGSVAAVAAAVAVALGLWANSLSDRLDEQRSALNVLADPNARSIDVAGAEGRLVVSTTGRAALVLSGVPRAPRGKTYEAWVIQRGEPRPSGIFDSDGGREVVALTRAVPDGAVVAVTLERDGGVEAPTGSPLFTAEA